MNKNKLLLIFIGIMMIGFGLNGMSRAGDALSEATSNMYTMGGGLTIAGGIGLVIYSLISKK